MRILVAEDEEDIRTVYHCTLVDRGHEVILTSDGEECLNVYQQKLQEQQKQRHPDGVSSSYYDIVILDYKMPKKDGLQTAKEILEINPEQRIIFASAYVTETLVASVKELKGIIELMQKPFSMSALTDTVEDREAYKGLNQLMSCIKAMKENSEPTSEQIRDLFEGLRKIQKHRY
jgi:CheY-like chemotaxis protein